MQLVNYTAFTAILYTTLTANVHGLNLTDHISKYFVLLPKLGLFLIFS